MWGLGHTSRDEVLLRLESTKPDRRVKFQPGDSIYIAIGRSGWSVGPARVAHDNAQIKSTIGLRNTEPVKRRSIGWRSAHELEATTARSAA